MRVRNAYLRLAALSIALFITRHHINALFGALRTYATFHSYLSKNPETLHRYHSPPNTIEFHQETFIPKNIHQIFLTDNGSTSLTKYKPSIDSCIQLHPSWTHDLWTDETASDFISQHYPHLWPHYISYKQTVQRANILRYAVLDHFGGVYLDLDITCLQPLDQLRHLPWLAPGAYPTGLSNGFMLSRPHHPFWKFLLAEVETSDLSWGLPYVNTMLSTGCLFLSTRWLAYARLLSKLKDSVPDDDRLYVLADQTGNIGTHMLRGLATTPLFHHQGASSWHAWDAPAIVLIGAHYYYFLFVMVLGALSAVGMIWTFSKRKALRRQSWHCVRHHQDSMDKSSFDDVVIVHRPFALC